MAPLDYIGRSLDDWDLYVLLAVLFLVLHGVLIRRWVVGLYDPLFMVLVSNAFGWSIVWFMYLRGDIAKVYVISFTAAQLALYLGMGVARCRRSGPVPEGMPNDDSSIAILTLVVAAAVHVGSTLAIWSMAGIPLFRASRLGAFEKSGGFGILERLAESSTQIAIFTTVFLLLQQPRLRRNFLLVSFMIWFVAAMALSGSKGALLGLLQYVLSIFFVYTGLRDRPDRFWGGAPGKLMLVVATVFAVGVLVIQQECCVRM